MTADDRPEILINGRFLDQRVTGVQRYARETLAALDERMAAGDGQFARWTLVLPGASRAKPDLKAITVERYGPLNGHAWEQLVLPWRAHRSLLLSFGFTGPLALRRQIITVHDAAVVRFPQSYNRTFRAVYRTLIPRVLRYAPAAIAVSNFSASEAVECFEADRSRLVVGAEGWQHLNRTPADEGVIDRHGLRGRPFVLAVSSPARNKNFAVIARALATLGPAAPLCVVVGAIDTKVFVNELPKDSPHLMHLGYVTDGELRALYAHARCFVMPSYYEGFGIPVIEAMANGCAVLASRVPSLREVGGAVPLYFDPDDSNALAALIDTLMHDEQRAADMVDAGRKRAQLYSWDANAGIHLDTLAQVVGGANVAPALG